MKKIITTIVSIFAIASVYANQVVYVVDTAQVYQNYYKAKESSAQIQSSVEQAQQQIQKMGEEHKALVAQVNELQEKIKNPTLSEQAKQDIAKEGQPLVEKIRAKEAEINDMRTKANQRIEQNIQSTRQIHLKEIREVVEKIGKDKNADFIFEKGVVHYSKPASDITQEVIAALNVNAPAAE